MWCYRLRAWQSSPLLVVVGFVLAAGVVVQLKTLYDNHQKHLRIVDYGASISAMTETVEHVDRVTGKLSLMIKRIEAYVEAAAARRRSAGPAAAANATAAIR